MSDSKKEYQELRKQLKSFTATFKDAIQEIGQTQQRVYKSAKRIGELQTEESAILEEHKKLPKADDILDESIQLALSKTFEAQAKIHKYRARNAEIQFFMISLIAISGIISFLIFAFISNFIFNIISQFWYVYPFFITITGLLVYLLWQRNNIRSEETRLCAEYTHKSVLANTYLGYIGETKRMLEADKNEDLHLRHKLLDNLIEAIKRNPSEALEHKSHSRTPLQDLNKLLEALKEVKKLLDSNR